MQSQDITFLSVIIIIAIIYYAGLWKVFEKAGEKGWKSIIPVYNSITFLKIIGKKWQNVFLLFIPGINIVYFFFGMLFELYRSFGKEKLQEQLLGIFFFFGYVSYLGFSGEKYLGPASNIPKVKKSQGREWADAIVFAVIAATIIRWLLVEAFKIPTPSMEKSLLMGDFLFVSKFHYGARTPQTPLQVPLTHQYWWWSQKSKSYSDLIQLPQYRLPGISEIKRNDVVVFNYPAEDDDLHKPVDLKTNYIKRCIAISGDTLQIKNQQVYINGEKVQNPKEMQFSYQVFTTGPLSKKVLNKYKIPNYERKDLGEGGKFKIDSRQIDEKNNKYVHLIHLTPETAKELQQKGYIDSARIIKFNVSDSIPATVFPNKAEAARYWTIDEYGPLWIPKKGATIPMTLTNLQIYGESILRYEDWDNAKISGDKLMIDGKAINDYTFKKDYYFMMGDNRHNSADSRIWGFVPENYVVGKALFIWFSNDQDPKKGFFESIRWDRIFKGIE